MIRTCLVVLLMLCAALPRSALAQSEQPGKVVGILFDTSGSMENRDQLPNFGMQMLAASLRGIRGGDRIIYMNFNQYLSRAPVREGRQIRVGPVTANEFTIVDATGTPILPSPDTVEQILSIIGRDSVRLIELTEATHQDAVDQIQAASSNPQTGTPYGPLEIMLDAMAKEIGEGETGHLIVISDGGYVERLPSKAQLEAHYRTHREAMKGPLSVEYLFVANRDSAIRAAEERTLAEQGVRDALLSVFNTDDTGQPRFDGAHTVSNAEELWEELQTIIARVSGTDRDKQKAYVTYEGSTIRIDAPLSIQRITIASTGLAAAPLAQRSASSFDVDDRDVRRLEAEMSLAPNELDTDLGVVPPPPRRGLVEHLIFPEGLPPGEHSIEFDAPVADNVFLMFATKATASLEVRDANGVLLQPGPNGRIRLQTGRAYEFSTQVLDQQPTGGQGAVPFDQLDENLSLLLQLDVPGARRPFTMDKDVASNSGRFTFTPDETGEGTARSRATVPGFLSPFSKLMQLEIVEPSAALTVTPVAGTEDCDACAPGEIGSQVVPNGPDVVVGSFEVTADAAIPGAIDLSASDLPDMLTIVDEAGQPVPLDRKIEMAPGQTRRFQIRRSGRLDVAQLGGGPVEFSVGAAPRGAWTGDSISVDAALRLIIGELEMVLRSVTQQGPTGDGLLVPGDELGRQSFKWDFDLVNLLVLPENERAGEIVTAEADGLFGWLIGFDPVFSSVGATGRHAFELRPSTSYWCLCFLGLEDGVTGGGRRVVAVDYRDLQGL
ncbi:MAG: hypothetical protein AAF677_03225 [Pseudomonadota bacterium]